MSATNTQTLSQIIQLACAAAAHHVNRAWCMAHGDDSQPIWQLAPDWQRASAVNGVAGAIAGNTPEQSHAAWMAEKLATGWTHGPVKDVDRKQHPCLVPYAELPLVERIKDSLFVSTVLAVHVELRKLDQAVERDAVLAAATRWVDAARHHAAIAEQINATPDDVGVSDELDGAHIHAIRANEGAAVDLLEAIADALGVEEDLEAFEFIIEGRKSKRAAAAFADQVNGGWGPTPVELPPAQIIDDPIPF